MSEIDYSKLAAAIAAQQPQKKSGKSPIAFLVDIGALVGLAVFLVAFWPAVQPTLLKWMGGTPQAQQQAEPTQRPFSGGGDTTRGSDPYTSNPPIAREQAPAPPAPIEAAPAGIDTRGQPIPTAVVIEQSPVVEVVPQAMPQEYAPGSDIRQPTVEVLPYPTPLADPMVGAGVSGDGKCVQAERGGKLYQVCQAWKYQPHEAASMADYLRTGLVPGEEVK